LTKALSVLSAEEQKNPECLNATPQDMDGRFKTAVEKNELPRSKLRGINRKNLSIYLPAVKN